MNDAGIPHIVPKTEEHGRDGGNGEEWNG
jgi:hypothetical protein